MYRIVIFLCLSAMACTNQTENPNRIDSTTNEANSTIQNASAASEALPTDSAINRIRKAYQQINAAPLKSQTFKWTAENCNGDGTATYYLTNNNEIMKVVETGAIGDGSWTTAYYYQDGRFVFSLQTDIGGPAVGPVDTLTVRKYVYADKVIRVMEKDSYTTPVDSVLTPASKEYRILEAYKNKNFGAAFCD